MNSMTQDLKDSAASVLTDPFKKQKMVSLSTHCYCIYGSWTYTGRICFKSGDTEGEQKFKSDSLSSLLNKMQAFIETMEG